MDTLPPELFLLIARFYLSPCTSIFAGELSLTGKDTYPARVSDDSPSAPHDPEGAGRISTSPSGDESPFVLCHISSRLRRITRSEPSLWSYLSICNPRRVEPIQLWLDLLCDAPLYLDLYLNYAAGPDSEIRTHDPDHAAYQTLKCLLQIAPQWKRARIGIYNAQNFGSLFIEIPAGVVNSVDLTGIVPGADILQRPEIDIQDYETLKLRATAAFRQLESLAIIDAPNLRLRGSANEYPSLPHPVYYPLMYAPHLKHIWWSFWSFPEWIVSPRHLLPGRWTTLTELVFVVQVSGENAYRILAHTQSLERFAPLGGLWEDILDPVNPIPGRYPNRFPTDRTIESGVRELVLRSGLSSFHALVQYVKFPRLRWLRFDMAAAVDESPRELVSVEDAWVVPSDPSRRSVVQFLLEGRDRSEVMVEVVEEGVEEGVAQTCK